MHIGLTLTVLGTVTPYPQPDQPCSGYLITGPGSAILVDAGPGTFAELQRYLDPRRLSAIWISHMHPDHAGDLPAVANWLLNSTPPAIPPLLIYGPAGWLERLSAFLPSDPWLLADRVQAHELTDGHITQVGELLLTSYAVQHSVPSFGLRITDGQHVLAYSGDSGPCEALTTLARHADLFLCEAGAAEGNSLERPSHCTPEDAARMAQQASATQLLLTHLSPEVDTPTARQQAQATHPNVGVARRGGVYRLG